MSDLERVGVSLEKSLLDRFDVLLKQQGYPNRTEAIRDLILDLDLEGGRVAGIGDA